jgi:integrase
LDISITRRVRVRKQRDGSTKKQVRHVVSWHNGKRNQRFFETKNEAIEYRDGLLRGVTSATPNGETVGDLVDKWLERQAKTIRPATQTAYFYYSRKLEPLFGVRIDKLTTKGIRSWYDAATGTKYSINRALTILKTVLETYAEDASCRAVAMPSGLSRNTTKQHKQHLSIEQVKTVISSGDIYLAFPFLTGTRISEMLGLLWSEVDLEAGVIRIARTQDKRTGKLIEATKTASSRRMVPINATLLGMLLNWRIRCPSDYRVFPAPCGGTLLYSNYLHRIWKPSLLRMGLPYVPIHSARASFISMLQASGVDVATAAKLVGHKSPNVTLKHYTHSLKDGAQAMNTLDRMVGANDGAAQRADMR